MYMLLIYIYVLVQYTESETGYELICSTGGHLPRPPPRALPPPPYTLFRVQRLFCDSLTCTNAMSNPVPVFVNVYGVGREAEPKF